MQYIRSLILFVSIKYFIKLSHGEPCEGPSCHLKDTPQSNLNSYITQLVNNATVRSPHKIANKIPFQGITESHTLNKKCCYNGGTCFLGSFCICPKQYTGRQCEYEKWPLDCDGGILNGEWVVRGCSSCRCFSGEIHCLAPVPECEESLNEENLGISTGLRLQHTNLIFLSWTLMTFLKCC